MRGDHVQRYSFARDTVRAGDILDVGCGHGFGALILGSQGFRYVGIDTDRDAILWACKTITPLHPWTNFYTVQEFQRGSRDERFDAIILYEVIEHVRDAPDLLSFCRARLKRSGLLLVSTPNGSLSRRRPELFQSRYHVREYTSMEVLTLLHGAGFRSQLFMQYRSDRLDVFPQRAKAALLPARMVIQQNETPSAPNLTVSPHQSGLSRLYSVLKLAPSWPGLWRIRPMQLDDAESTKYSHIVAICGLEPKGG